MDRVMYTLLGISICSILYNYIFKLVLSKNYCCLNLIITNTIIGTKENYLDFFLSDNKSNTFY